MSNEPSGEYFDYTKTMKPERPWMANYHQSLVYKIMNAYKDSKGNLKEVMFTFQQTLDLIERIHNMTLGMPQIAYLTGWQYNGHDSKYPAWEEVNEALKRPEDDTALDSLRWLIRTAKEKFNCDVSLHINIMDAYPESPYWEEYLEKDIIAKDKDGNPIGCNEWSGMIAYAISYTQEWKLGYTQKRIDKLLDMVPELVDTGTIHVDAFLGSRQKGWKNNEPISPYLGYSKEEEAATMRKIYRYFRNKGLDITSEYAFGLRDDRYVGLQPWCWHQEHNVAELPDSLYCSTKWVGCDMWFLEDRNNPPHTREKFYLEVVPWHLKNHGEGTKAFTDSDATDICLPALWTEERTAVAYSKNGYEEKTWELPPNWIDAKSITVQRITWEGLESEEEVEVKAGKFTLNLQADEAVRLQPKT